MSTMSTCRPRAVESVSRAQLCCFRGQGWRPAPPAVLRELQPACRAAFSGGWGRLPGAVVLRAVAAAAAASNGRPLSLLEDTALLQASPELQELARLQLQLLLAALQLSLQAGSLRPAGGAASSSADEDELRQQWLLDSGLLTCLRCTVYCRAPGSLQTGQLQLQLIASSDDVGAGSAAGAAGLQQQQQHQAQQAQRFLFLGQDGLAGGSSLHDQEQWILEQPVIVLPDSGGLVLPLAHNGFLVGLMVVERCLNEDSTVSAAAGHTGGSSGGAAADAAAGAAGGSAAASSMPQPPACLLFRSAELALLKQTAAALALACAMDLRAALERVGAAYRQRQASALVQAAKKPLSVMRTLGTMLLPRLQPGEPDRDFAQGILEQGAALQAVVTQLQAALHPAAAAPVVPPALQPGAGQYQQQQQRGPPPPPGRQPRKALSGGVAAPAGTNGSSISGAGGSRGGAVGGEDQWQLPEAPRRPALPSSSIGSDYQWGGEAGTTIDMMVESEQLPEAAGMAVGARAQAQAVPAGTGSGSGGGAESSPTAAPVVYGSRASADLLNVLMPLLASASNFAAVNGITFVMAGHGGSSGGGGSNNRGAGAAGSQPAAQLALTGAEVAVGPGTLKRMLSQLIDGMIACAARGDLLQASAVPQQWQGRPGVAITLCCCYSLAHDGGGGGGGGNSAMAPPLPGTSGGPVAAAVAPHAGPPLPRPPLQPEFAFLQGSACEAGGWFEVYADATPDVQHLNSSALAATLWLPTVSCDAGWQ